MTLNELLHKQTLTIPTIGTILAYGNSVPADGTAGYSTGCLFLHIDGGPAQAAYVNEGTAQSCNFVLLST